MPELTYAVSKAVNNNTGNAETRKPNDAFAELDTLLQARAGDMVTTPQRLKKSKTRKVTLEAALARAMTKRSSIYRGTPVRLREP